VSEVKATEAPAAPVTMGGDPPNPPAPPASGVVSSAPTTEAAPASMPIEAAPASTTLRSEPEPKKEPEAPPPPPDPFAGKTAAELIELARARLAERDAKAAVAACEAARTSAPDDADVIALAAWARFQGGSADVKALTIELDELLAARDGHVEARYYRAMLRK